MKHYSTVLFTYQKSSKCRNHRRKVWTVAEQRTFPQDISNQLLGVDYRILDELAFLSKQQQKKSGAAYAMPGRAYLAHKLSVSIRTISRSIARLKRLGILDSIQRRPVRGQWKTNLYRLRHWFSWRLGQLSGVLRKLSHRGTPKAHITFSIREIKAPDPLPPTKNSLSEKILGRWREKGLLPAT